MLLVDWYGFNWLLDILDWLRNVLDWLLDVLDGLLDILDGLLDHLDGLLDDFLDWLVDYLSFNGLVFGSFLDSFLSNVFYVFLFNWHLFNYHLFNWDLFVNHSFLGDLLNVSILVDLGNVVGDVFDCVVISDYLVSGYHFLFLHCFVFDYHSLFWDLFLSGHSFVFSNCLLIWDVFNTAFSLNWSLLNLSHHWLWLLDYLRCVNWLRYNLLRNIGHWLAHNWLGSISNWLWSVAHWLRSVTHLLRSISNWLRSIANWSICWLNIRSSQWLSWVG